MLDKRFTFNFAPVAIEENIYDILFDIILNIKFIDDDWLCVTYSPKRKDKISCIQTCRDGNGIGSDAEIVMNFYNNNQFSIFSFYTEDIRDVLNIFHYVCVDFKCPIDVRWVNKCGKTIQIIENKKDLFIDPSWHDITNTCNYLNINNKKEGGLAMDKLLLPNEYLFIEDEFPEMGFPTKDGEIYGTRAEEYSAIILSCIVPDKVAMNFDNVQSIIDDFHNNMPDNSGLIEAKNGLTSKENKYIYYIMKHSIEGDNRNHLGNEYTMNLNLSLDDDIYFVQSSFSEEGTTGIRDSSIMGLLANKEGSIAKVFEDWSNDPYDDKFDKGFLMNKSEEEQYDKLFPNHPLSKARELVRFIIDNN